LTFGDQNMGTTSAPKTVTLTNRGNAPLTISSITASGAYAQTNDCVSPLAAGAHCTINVTFTPTVVGGQSGVLTITDNAPGSPHTVALNGVGLGPVATLAPTSLDFGNQPVGSTSWAHTELHNSGNAPMTISSIVASGDFSTTNTCPLSPSQMAVRSGCIIYVTFTPLAAGARTGTITITDDAPNSPQTISLSGTGTGGSPVVTLSATSLDFGSQPIGTPSAPQSVIITNTGTASLTISSINGSPDFPRTENCPIGRAMAVGASCTSTLTFTPTGVGLREGTLTIASDAPGSPHLVNLSGTGVGPAVTLSANTLHFADQPLGTTTAPQTVTLTNSGNAPLTISSITTSGAYAQSNNCVSTLAAGASCAITVTFTPTVVGGQSGTLTIADDASGSPHTVALNGIGLGAVATLSKTSLDFANQFVGSTGSAQTVTLTNSGNAPMTISSITASGDFAQTHDCGTSLAATASCTISATFTPTAAGSRTGALTITDNTSGSPHTVALAGTGSDFALSSDPTSRTVTAGQSATYTLSVGPVSGFNQAVALSCTKPTQLILATCSVSPSAVTPDGANAATVTVTVTTTARGMAPPFGGHRPPLQDSPLGRHGGLPLQVWLVALLAVTVVAAAFRPPQANVRLKPNATLLPLTGMLLLALLWAACGGGGAAPPPHPGTPAGTYTLTVTGTVTTGSGNLSHDLTLTLKVN
jgi:hypothetical protein